MVPKLLRGSQGHSSQQPAAEAQQSHLLWGAAERLVVASCESNCAEHLEIPQKSAARTLDEQHCSSLLLSHLRLLNLNVSMT